MVCMNIVPANQDMFPNTKRFSLKISNTEQGKFYSHKIEQIFIDETWLLKTGVHPHHNISILLNNKKV